MEQLPFPFHGEPTRPEDVEIRTVFFSNAELDVLTGDPFARVPGLRPRWRRCSWCLKWRAMRGQEYCRSCAAERTKGWGG